MSNRPAERSPRGVLVVLVLAGLSFALSQTLVIPALPALARELDASPSSVSWVITGFLLSSSVATPIIGKLGDVFGRGRVLAWVMVTFSIGAVVCAVAPSVEVLIAGRVIQGVASGVFPLAFGIVRDTFPPARVTGGLGLIGSIFGIGGGIGLPLSGVIIDHVDVAWLFWANLISVPAALAAFWLVPPSPAARRMRIDWLGAAVLSVALSALLLGVSQAGEWGWGSVAVLGLVVGGAAAMALFVVIQASVREPLIELAVLRRPVVAATNLASFLSGAAMFVGFLLIPQIAMAPRETGYGFAASATVAGLIVAPAALSQLFTGTVGRRLGALIGFRAVLWCGTVLITLASLLLAFAHDEAWELLVAGTVLGTGISFCFASLSNLVVAAVPPSDVGIATGIQTVTRTVGGAFGSAAAIAILAGDVVEATGQPSDGAYTAAFVFAAVVGVLALGAALWVPRTPREPAPGAGVPAPASAG
jgi:EmrB/QacA subfamily drug resistance transporter